MTIGAQDALTTLFSRLDLAVRDQVVFAVVVNNASSGLQRGLTVWDPPVLAMAALGLLVVGAAVRRAQSSRNQAS